MAQGCLLYIVGSAPDLYAALGAVGLAWVLHGEADAYTYVNRDGKSKRSKFRCTHSRAAPIWALTRRREIATGGKKVSLGGISACIHRSAPGRDAGRRPRLEFPLRGPKDFADGSRTMAYSMAMSSSEIFTPAVGDSGRDWCGGQDGG